MTAAGLWGHRRKMDDARRRAITGLALAAVVSGAARRARALSRGGAVAAAAVGSAVFVGAGWSGSAALATFFVSSSLLGRLPAPVGALRQARGNERDAIQVLANGGVPALLALVATRTPATARPVLRAGFAGAVAAATADTWATEVGSRFGGQPRAIASMRPVPCGASGGVTALGSAASILGALSIAAVAATSPSNSFGRPTPFAVTAGGVAGSLVDSLLGATVQAVRFCDVCGEPTEVRTHRCGRETRVVRGAAWCSNDAVNLLAIASGAATAMALTIWSPHAPEP